MIWRVPAMSPGITKWRTINPRNANKHYEEVRQQLEAEEQAKQPVQKLIQMQDGSTVRWNKHLRAWQDIHDPSKTYPEGP
jgi:hypothetical protein